MLLTCGFGCLQPDSNVQPAVEEMTARLRLEVDGAAVLGAADAAVRLWADDPYCSAD